MEDKNMIEHPEHYNSGEYECIDVMIDIYGIDEVIAFCRCNAFKYVWRAENKNGVEDLQKAQWYLDKIIELEKRKVKDKINKDLVMPSTGMRGMVHHFNEE